jgi:hypothetical protein
VTQDEKISKVNIDKRETRTIDIRLTKASGQCCGRVHGQGTNMHIVYLRLPCRHTAHRQAMMARKACTRGKGDRSLTTSGRQLHRYITLSHCSAGTIFCPIVFLASPYFAKCPRPQMFVYISVRVSRIAVTAGLSSSLQEPPGITGTALFLHLRNPLFVCPGRRTHQNLSLNTTTGCMSSGHCPPEQHCDPVNHHIGCPST